MSTSNLVGCLILSTVFILTISSVDEVRADTNANCTYEDIRGTWLFHETAKLSDKTINCSSPINHDQSIVSAIRVRLDFPDAAFDLDSGSFGYWTLIYNQGFEVQINDRLYFAFSKENACAKHTEWGWAHAPDVDPKNWSCFIGAKLPANTTAQAKPETERTEKEITVKEINFAEKRLFKQNRAYLRELNGAQSSWKATHYPFMSELGIDDLIRRAGGKKSRYTPPTSAKPLESDLIEAATLPKSFDWRNINGTSFVSPIRNQGSCGSCYSFGSTAMMEARLRILTNNEQQTVYSPQDIVACSQYSQGCEGGFPYLVAGKYAQDFGMVAEECNPYQGVDQATCTTPQETQKCQRHYGTEYKYVGGFYGACNEPLMRIALVHNGPVAVSFQVYDDFMHYHSGIYHHQEGGRGDQVNFGFNPWEVTNHVVLVVGYGEENGERYWIVKNSWGEEWGEKGYFRIRRGTDECSIESIAVDSFPVIQN